MNPFIRAIRGGLRKLGVDIVRYDPEISPIDHKRYLQIITSGEYDAILDIGANIGQYGQSIIPFIDSKIDLISFEPLPNEYEKLKRVASKYPNWKVYDRVAIGEESGTGKMKVTQNSVSSSLLDIDSKYEGSESDGLQKIEEIETPIKTLNEILAGLDYKKVFLKADVQGYEKPVLKGSLKELDRIQSIHLEFSCVPHYKGQESMSDLFSFVTEMGFKPILFLPHTTFNSKHELQQVDIVFSKNYSVK